MKLNQLTLTNYGSFVEPTVFTFPEEPGLYFMRGDNRVDPRLGGNGAGKSTLWNALYWLAYGKTPDGRKAGDIANWTAGKGTKVELHYSYSADTDVFVERTWGPISWSMTLVEDSVHNTTIADLTKGDSNPFLDDVGASGVVFLQSVMMAQGEPMFLDMKRDAQAELFGAVLGLDRWLDYSSKASKLARDADDKCRKLEAELAKLEGKLEASRDYGDEIRAFEVKRRQRLDALNTDLDFANSGAVGDKRKLEIVQDQLTKLSEWLVPRRERMDADKQALEDHDKTLDASQRQVDALIAECEAMQALAQRALDGETCPTCGVNLQDHHDPHGFANKLKDDAEALTYRAATARDDLAEAKKANKRIEAKWDESCDLYDETRDEADALEQEARRLRNEIDRTNRHMDQLEDQLDAIKKEPNPFRGMHEDALERARSSQAELNRVRQGLDSANEKFSLYGLWVRGFKDIRLQQIAEALTELEVEVNSSLAELGLDGWELRFDVDRETKGGSVQRGFAVTVLSPANKKPVPWQSWSGGEQQRLRLAGNMGLANLIRTRMGVTFPLEVWDEPTKGLSPQGVQDLLACLERRARVEGRQIWVIDHTAHSFGGFAGTATIIKDRDGSRIVQS